MANRYWVGGSGTWSSSDTSHWSASSGGASGASVPTSSDNVFFNGSSGGGTCTLGSGTLACADFVATGYAGTITGSTRTIAFYGGTVTFGSGMTFVANLLDIRGTATVNLTTNGVTLTVNGLRLIGGGSEVVVLQDDLTVVYATNASSGYISFQFTGLTFDANDHNVTCGRISNASAGTTYMGSGTWTITGQGSSGTVWGINASQTIHCETSTVIFTGTYATVGAFEGRGKTWYNVVANQAGGALVFEGSSTFNNITVNAGREVRFEDGTTQTVGSFVAIGTSGNEITLTGTSTGGWAMTDSSGTNAVEYCDISYSTVGGGATWDASDGTSTDVTGNSGWDFGVLDITVNPSALSATFSLPSATVTATVSVTVSSSVLTATFSTQSATELIDEYYTPPQPLALTFSTPSVNVLTPDSYNDIGSPLSATFDTPSPTITAERYVTVDSSVLTATFSLPSSTQPISSDISASPLELTFSLPSSVVSATQTVTVSPSVLAMTFSIPTATETVSVSIAPSVLAMTFSLPSSTITTIQNIVVSVEVLSMILNIPSFFVRGDFWQEKFLPASDPFADKYPVASDPFTDKVYTGSDNWADKF